MKPEDPLSEKFDISFLAGEALREEEAKKVVSQLDSLFEAGKSFSVVAGNGLKYLYQRVNHLVGTSLFPTESVEMTQPYERFEHSGVSMVSRIVRMHSAPRSRRPEGVDRVPMSLDFDDSDIYLIALMGENQTVVGSKNCPIGAIKTGSGQVEFFKIEDNPNLGKVVAREVVRDHDSDRILSEMGHIDQNKINVTVLTPEEKYLAAEEFDKAVNKLAN
jgi:hypothetical protein